MILGVAALAFLASQQPRVVLETQLGGDSARTRPLQLSTPNSYRIEVRPANAMLVVRGQPGERGYTQMLALNPIPNDTTVAGGTSYTVTPSASGPHMIELAAATPLARIRVVESPPLTGDVRAVVGRSEMIFSEMISPSPTYIWLDTGVVYRFVTMDDAYIAPRMVSGAPVRLAPLVRGGGHGVPFLANQPGEYGLTTTAGTTSLRIYREAADAAEMACIRNPMTAGCRAASGGPRKRPWGILLAIVALPIAAYMLSAN